MFAWDSLHVSPSLLETRAKASKLMEKKMETLGPFKGVDRVIYIYIDRQMMKDFIRCELDFQCGSGTFRS